MKQKLRYQDFVNEQKAGAVHGVFVDDTGSPGLANTPGNLHPDRKSWVAVIIPRSHISEVWCQLRQAIDELSRLTGATEFHFTDIYAGRRQFKEVTFEKRLAIFAFMAHIWGVYHFPIIVQTLDPHSLIDVRARGAFPERLGPFNLTRPEDLALFFLLIRVKWYLEQNFPTHERVARVFVDEGCKKSGAAACIPPWRRVFCDGLICFASSDSILPLQLADFAAFCLNRTQLIIGKSEPTDMDLTLLRIIQPIAWNYQNIPKMSLTEWLSEGERPL